MPKTEKNESNAATQAAEKIKPDETRRVKTAPVDLSAVHIGDVVNVMLAPGRKLRSPGGGFYNPATLYSLVVDVTLLRRLRHGDWVLPAPSPETY